MLDANSSYYCSVSSVFKPKKLYFFLILSFISIMFALCNQDHTLSGVYPVSIIFKFDSSILFIETRDKSRYHHYFDDLLCACQMNRTAQRICFCLLVCAQQRKHTYISAQVVRYNNNNNAYTRPKMPTFLHLSRRMDNNVLSQRNLFNRKQQQWKSGKSWMNQI